MCGHFLVLFYSFCQCAYLIYTNFIQKFIWLYLLQMGALNASPVEPKTHMRNHTKTRAARKATQPRFYVKT